MTNHCSKCASFMTNENIHNLINNFFKNKKITKNDQRPKIIRYCKKCKKYNLIKIYKNKVKMTSYTDKINKDDTSIFEDTKSNNTKNSNSHHTKSIYETRIDTTESHNIKNKKCKCNKIKNNDVKELDNLKNIETENINGNYLNNSYPYGNLGYNFPAHSYCIQKEKIPNINKYFKNDSLNYNVQINKPIFSYDNYIMQKEIKAKNSCNCRYNQNNKPKKFVYNGNFEIANNKPNKLIVQANLNNPMYSQTIINNNNNNLTLGYNDNLTTVPGTIQSIEKTPLYTGVQAKTLPGQNLIAERNAEQTKANNANLNNPAYFNYGQYYY